MSRRLAALALVLAVLATVLVGRQFGLFGAAREGEPRHDGPAVEGARGRLAYAREGELWTYDLAQGVERRLPDTAGGRAPRWAGNGIWLSFERDGRLWVVKSDGSGKPAAVPGGDVPSSARWTSRGGRLAYSSSDGSLSIFEAAAGERGRRQLVQPGSGAGPGLAWASDGLRLAYDRHQPGGRGASNEGIWSISGQGRDSLPVFVASGDYALVLCCWTASNRHLYFWQGTASAADAAGGLPLYVARAASSQPVQVGSEPVLLHETWLAPAPRADAVALVTGAGRDATAGKRLVVAEPRVAGNRLVVETLAVESRPEVAPATPSWAPQATSLAYSLGPSLVASGGDLARSLAGRRIVVSSPTGEGKRPLLADATVPPEVSDERPLWARNGRTLVFARRLAPEAAARAPQGRAGGIELWVATASGGSARRVVGGLHDPGMGSHGALDWPAIFDYYGA